MMKAYTRIILAVAMVVGMAGSGAQLACAQAWTPASLPNLALWLDGSDTNTLFLDTAGTSIITNNGAVARWNDKSGNNRHIAQTTSTKRPTYPPNIQNGRNALSFDGSDDSLFTNATTITLSQPVHRFIVCKFLTKTSKSVVFDGESAAFFFYNGESAGSWVFNAAANVSFGTSDVTSNHIHYQNVNGATSYCSVDGATTLTGPNNPDANTLQGVRIGNIRNELAPGYAFQGYVYEVVLVQGTLSTADRQKLEGYLAWKWGLVGNLPADHPYKNLVIANQAASSITTTSAVFNATLSATATNADVTVFWGPTDGTNNPSAWTNSAYAGSWNNVFSTNITFATNGFNAGTSYYYTFRATNSTTNVWASPSTNFTTAAPPTLSVTLTNPSSGQQFAVGSSISATATVVNGTSPYTVAFYTNVSGGAYGPAGSTNASPYTVNLGTLPAGTYGIYASVTDSVSATATSTTNTFTVLVPASSFFWTNTVSGGWDVAGNWTNDVGTVQAPVPVGQTNYSLNFNNAGTYTASNSLNTGFLLNQLNFGGATVTLAGNSMAFTNNGAALPQINQNSAAAVTVSNNIVLGANATLGGSGAGTVTVASVISGANSLTMTHTGTLTLSGDNSLTGLFGAQAGTVVNTANWVGNSRSQQKVQVGGSATAALWTNTIPLTIGVGSAGISNTFTVATQGTLRVNGGLTVGTNAAAYNALVVTNGGQAFSTAASTIGFNATNNSALVVGGGSGVTSLWNLGGNTLDVGSGAATGNVLKVDGNGVAGGAMATNVGAITIGLSGAQFNTLIITNGGKMSVNAVETRIGNGDGSPNNRLLIDNGTFTSSGGLFVGLGNSANAGKGNTNLLAVANGGVVSVTKLFVGGYDPTLGMGYGGSSNNVAVAGTNSAGAKATINVGGGVFQIGNAPGVTNNLVLIGSGGIITNTGAVTVGGNGGIVNSMIITNGGQLFSGTAAHYIGNATSNNTVGIVGGSAGTSFWNLGNQTLYVGYNPAISNSLTVNGAGVAGSAVVTNSTIYVGYGTGANANSVLVTNGGQVFAGLSNGRGPNAATSFSNTVTIVGGAAQSTWNALGLEVDAGGWGNANNGYNQLLIGSGGILTNAGGGTYKMNVGFQWGAGSVSYSNWLTVTDGGKLYTVDNLYVGYAYAGTASNNTMLIANTGLVSVAGGMYVGSDYIAGAAASKVNSLIITNGGQLFTTNASYIGYAQMSGSAALGNAATIAGTNSVTGASALWNLGGKNLTVGSAISGATATGNGLTVNAGGVVTNLASLTVPAANSLTLGAGGQIYASAATNAGTLSVNIDDTATPACGRLTVSGNLNISGATLNIAVNGSPAGSAYVIASYDTRTAGNFAATNGLPYGWVLDLNYNSGKAIALVPPAPPTLVSLSPVNNATDVLVSTPLVANFSENISLTNGGVITITNLTAGTATDIVLPSAQVTANGAVLTITPAANLAYSSTYAVLIGTNTIRDPLGLVAFAGITNTTTWSFITQAPVTTLGIANLAVSGSTASSAVFNATLQTPGADADVFVYWGPADGTNNPAAWSNTVHVGSWTDVASTNIGFTTNGLTPDTRYYYTFLATNAATNIWASPSATFATLRPSAAVARYWDGGVANIPGDGNGASAGGAGTWDATLQNWDAGAVPHEAWNSTYHDTAIFGGAVGGTVSLIANVTVGGLTFNTAGYTISGVNTLAFGADGSIAVNADTTLSTIIGGSAAVAKTGGGTLMNSGDNTLTGLFSVQTGTVVNTANWVGNSRSQQKVQVGGYGAAALWTNSIPMTFGSGAAGVSNTVTVATQGTLRVNGGLTVGTSGATFNSLIVTNGGQVFSTNGASTIGYNATNNSVQVIGGGSPASLWNLGNTDLTIGYGAGTGNILTVDGAGVAGGAIATNVGAIMIGNVSGAQFNTLIITNGGKMFVNAFETRVGNGDGRSNNRLLIDNGTFTSSGGLFVGLGSVISGGTGNTNLLAVANGGLVSVTKLFVGGYDPTLGMGYGGSSNNVAVAGTNSNGAKATISVGGGVFQIGNAPGVTNNLVLIGSGGIITNTGAVTVGGNGGIVNSLVITNGGQLFSGGAPHYIGNGGTNNTVQVIGGSAGTSLWNLGNQTLAVGSGAATGNVLTVSAGGVVTNLANLVVSATNSLSLLAGGRVYAGAATVAGTMTAGLDAAVLSACSRLTVSGNLNITGATLNLTVPSPRIPGLHVIATYATLTGSFAATNGLPPGCTLDCSYQGTNIAVNIINEAQGTVYSIR